MHLGSARTALFNWIFAQQNDAEFILRIEDTNTELSQPKMVENIVRTLSWLGITFDREPIFQSQYLDLYNEQIDNLIGAGHAYHSEGAVWFGVPGEGTIGFDDIIRGRVEFTNATLKDFVLRRSDGSPTFVVANTVDDVYRGITHIIRGEDLINITPQSLLLRQALGADEPVVYAHLPLIVNAQKKKLSKRRDDVAVEEFRDRGVLPQAMVNYLALLGWGPPDDVEVRPIEEIIDLWRLENVTASSAVFDLIKMEAINADYIRALSPGQFADAIEPWVLKTDWGSTVDLAPAILHSRLEELAPLIQQRTRLLADAPAQLEFFFVSEPQIEPSAWEKVTADAQQSAQILAAAIDAYGEFDWERLRGSVSSQEAASPGSASPASQAAFDEFAQILRQIGESVDLKLRLAQMPVRVAITGSTVGPPLFESMAALGRNATLRRLRSAHARLATLLSTGTGQG